ncbi:hypothetical protein [Moritella viscosa]|uniref:hypothetical protein n=1 Tax=Moritella viscosa TaxID=80854 RepID=UPI000920F3E0|nr:hypothetical protein [Moritella viscosa]SGZ15674.1 Flagellar hook-associated protein FlgK [Moritella viscosa]
MKYLLSGLLLIFSFTTFASDDSGEIKNCYPAKQFGAKYGNWADADLKNNMDLEACSKFLKPQDERLSTNSFYATKDDYRNQRTRLDELGNDTDRTIEHADDENIFSYYFLVLAMIYGFASIGYIMTNLLAAGKSGKVSDGATSTVREVLTSSGIVNLPFILLYITIETTASWNFMTHKGAPIEDLKEFINFDFSELSQTFHDSNAHLADSMIYAVMIDTATSLNEMTHSRISGVKIDATVFGDKSNDNKPSIASYNDYESECMKMSSYADVSSESSLSIANFSFNRITTEAKLRSGGDTNNYNCIENFDGVSKTVTVFSRIPEITKNWLGDSLDADLGQELNFTQGFSAMFNKAAGAVGEENEKITNTASQYTESIINELHFAELAVKQSKESNVEIDTKTTSAFKGLVKLIESNMGDNFAYEEIEGISRIDYIAKDTSKLQQYKYARIYGREFDESEFSSDVYKNGYFYLSQYIRKTSLLALELDCINTDGQEEQFLKRKNFAEQFNSQGKNSLAKNSLYFAEVSPLHCYKYENGILTEGANPEDRFDIEEEIENRTLAIITWLKAMDTAGMNLILSNQQMNYDLIVDTLNSLDTTISSSVDAHSMLVNEKQKILKAFSVANDSYRVQKHQSYNTEVPSLYYNFGKHYENVHLLTAEKQAKKALSKGLPYYDLKWYFDILDSNNITEKNRQVTEAKGNLASILTLNCQITRKDGSCFTPLAQLNQVSLDKSFLFTTTMIAYKGLIDLGEAGCASGNISDGGASAVFGTVLKGAGGAFVCGAVNLIDGFNEIFVSPAIDFGMVGTTASFATTLTPVLIDAVSPFYVLLFLLVNITLYCLVRSYEMSVNVFKYLSSFKDGTTEESIEAFEQLNDFRNSDKILKAIAYATVAPLVLVYIWFFFYLSPVIGGFLYDMGLVTIPSDAGSALFSWILQALIFIVATYVLTFKIIPHLYSKGKDIFNIQSSSSQSSNVLDTALVTAVGMKAMEVSTTAKNKVSNVTKKAKKAAKYKKEESLKESSNPIPTKSFNVNKSVNTKVSNEPDTTIKADTKYSKDSKGDLKAPRWKQGTSYKVRSDKEKKDLSDLLDDVNRNNPRNGKKDENIE